MFDNFKFILLYCIVTIFFILTYSDTNAQSSISYQWYLNANAGLSQLHGDIQNEDNHYTKLKNETELGFGFRLGRYISPVFAGHFQFLKADFKGQKDQNNLEYNSDLMEYQLGVTVNFINLFFKNKERRFNFYGTTGFGAIFFRSEARYSNGELFNEYGYTKSGAKGNRESSFVFPVGLGLDVKLADRWYVNLESAIRFTLTDKLDAAIKGDQNDAYYYTSLGVSFNFAGKKKEEEFIEPPPPIAVDTIKNVFDDIPVNLIYFIPDSLRSLDEFVMKCEIHKGQIDGPAKLTQILPIGFEVLDTVISNAHVDFKNYTLVLDWDELPKNPVVPISYNVKLDKIYGRLPLSSILYIDKTDKLYRFKTNVKIERFEPELLIADQEPIKDDDAALSPENQVEFRIQVRSSYKEKLSTQMLSNKYRLSDEIKENYSDNWYRYTIGSFENYKDAKEFKQIVRGKHGVHDAL